MVRTLFIILGLISLIGGGSFVYRHFRGARPAILPAKPFTTNILNPQAETVSRLIPDDLGLILPSGFSISIFADDLGSARVLRVNPFGGLIVSIPSDGSVVSLQDKNDDGFTESRTIVAGALNKPHGIAWECITLPYEGASEPSDCALFIAETNRIVRYRYDQTTHQAVDGQLVMELPAGGNHWTRTIARGPDGYLYVSIGSSCNVCNEKDQRRGSIYRITPIEGNQPYATGLRNSVFFTWHPKTKKMWATDMGRDLLGDDTPPDEINIIEEGKNYGWPYCYGKNVVDPFGNDPSRCRDTISSHIDPPAHSAPLGLAFVPENSRWPKEYWGDLLVAYHGSWNRTVPTGYKIVRVKLDENGNSEGIEDFITGWLAESGEATGRPVDLLFGPDGTLYISDDKAGVIYRVQWQATL